MNLAFKKGGAVAATFDPPVAYDRMPIYCWEADFQSLDALHRDVTRRRWIAGVPYSANLSLGTSPQTVAEIFYKDEGDVIDRGEYNGFAVCILATVEEWKRVFN